MGTLWQDIRYGFRMLTRNPGLALVVALTMAVGLAGAAVFTRMLRALLFQVEPLDLPTFASVSILLAGVALLAGYLPARRAVKIDPAAALRHE